MITQNYLLLHNIRSIYNVGAIFRTADAIGIARIYISGTTPAPIDRFGRMRKDIAKVSLGAEKSVSWESIEDIPNLIRKLKKEKIKIIGLEQDSRSIDYKKAKINKKNLVILGEEVNGIEKGILDLCDEIIEIPMKGKKESLNVSVATGIVLYSLFD
ncbi:MAG TPA: TrmH family RNA methyltransferase [Candidatus Paceibacterota bacterium]